MRKDDARPVKARTPAAAAPPPISDCIETPETEPGAGIKISEKDAVKSGTKPIAIGRQATRECFVRRADKKSFLMKKS
jgi:hypothetical protein